MDDVVTPYFRERSARGDVIITPMAITKETHYAEGKFGLIRSVLPSCAPPNHPTGGTVYAYQEYFGPWLHYLLSGAPVGGSKPLAIGLLAESDIANAISVASTAAWSKASAHNADVLTDIAEMRKTLTMLRNPFSSTTRFLRNIKARQKGVGKLRGKEATEYFNNQWLQYRYGIRPLVNSVQGIVKSLQEVHGNRRSTYRGSYSLSATQVATGLRVGANLKHGYQYDYTDQLSVRAGMLIEDVVTLADSLGVDAGGMLALPWELVPYSFVADWFANTNAFLSGLVPYLTKRPLGSWLTVERMNMVEFRATSTTPTNNAYTVLTPAVEFRVSEYITKTRQPGIPGPTITWKPQAMTKVLDDLRIVDAFSLVTNLFFNTFKNR
jgi:hypothetical protein